MPSLILTSELRKQSALPSDEDWSITWTSNIKDHPNAGGNHKKSMLQSVEGSLKRLNVDYIDLFWIHLWDYSTDIADVMRNLNDLVQQGKILHFGLCNTPAWVVARGQTIAMPRGWEPISALQYTHQESKKEGDKK